MTPFGQQKLVCFISVLMITVLVTSCGTGSGSNSQKVSMDGTWSTGMISETPINNLNTFEGFLYAASDSGLYKKNLENNKNDWNSIGLQTRQVIDLGFLPDHKLLAAVRISDFNDGIPSLFLSKDNGQHWQQFMNDYGGKSDVTMVEELETTSKPSDTLLAGEGIIYARSLDGGKNWHLLSSQRWDIWGGSINFITADPYHKGHVWIGGNDAIFTPFLNKSIDYGNDWEKIDMDEAAWDILTSPTNINKLLVAADGIRRTTDGGDSWTKVFAEARIYTLTHSTSNPEIIYASGRNKDSTLFFAASRDFGDHWQTVTMPDSPNGTYVNDMVSVMQDGHEVLYLGTNKGVYSYTFDK